MSSTPDAARPHEELVFIDEGARPAASPSVVVIGNFDGVHRGHQAVLAGAVDEARARGLAPYVLTFDPHPSEVLGRGSPPLLATLPRRVELMWRLGIERVFARRFDLGFASFSPETFARELARMLLAKVVVVGKNFRFGAKRSGDLPTLRALGAELGFEAKVFALASDDKGVLSSTRAREAIGAGDLDEARRVLGRWHAISGVVAHGDERGRTLGFPTANLERVPEMLPPNGVYAVAVDTLEPGRRHGRALGLGVMNIGVRPTVAAEPSRRIEVHVLDRSPDLYGAELRVHLVERLREERKFAGLDALTDQIAKDVARAREALSDVAPVAGAYG